MLHRFKKQDMYNVDIQKAPWKLSYGLLLLGELNG